MRYFKFVLFLIVVFLFLQLLGCETYNKDGVYYYKELQDALLDIDEQYVGRRDQNSSVGSSVTVTLQDGSPTICLLKDITTDNTIRLSNTNLNLNGFTLENNKSSLIMTYGFCHIYNGALYRACDNESRYDGIVISKNSTCRITDITFKSESSNCTNIAIHVYGKMFMDNSAIEVSSSASNHNIMVIGVYSNLLSNVNIDKSSIIAKADFGRVEGVYIGDVGRISNSNIVAYANYQSNEVEFTSCAIGCHNDGILTINNCDIYGVHSGVNSSGSLTVDAGTYRGYGHGGIYCAGASLTYIITNATILQAEMPIGYKDAVGCMQGGMYIGGGTNKNNIKVFIDNCIIKATKNPIVLRGTSGEKNNSLYISNTIIDVKHIRVDNDTHLIYLGEGCNFEVSHVDIPNVVVYTGVSYSNIDVVD
jgi:hypothetical protein